MFSVVRYLEIRSLESMVNNDKDFADVFKKIKANYESMFTEYSSYFINMCNRCSNIKRIINFDYLFSNKTKLILLLFILVFNFILFLVIFIIQYIFQFLWEEDTGTSQEEIIFYSWIQFWKLIIKRVPFCILVHIFYVTRFYFNNILFFTVFGNILFVKSHPFILLIYI